MSHDNGFHSSSGNQLLILRIKRMIFFVTTIKYRDIGIHLNDIYCQLRNLLKPSITNKWSWYNLFFMWNLTRNLMALNRFYPLKCGFSTSSIRSTFTMTWWTYDNPLIGILSIRHMILLQQDNGLSSSIIQKWQ